MESNHFLRLEGTNNCRELGGFVNKQGKVIKYHKLLRSDRLNSLTDTDIACLVDYGLKTIVDFRGAGESEQTPNRIIPGTEYISLPVHEESRQGNPLSEQEMLQIFVEASKGDKNAANNKEADKNAADTNVDLHMKKSYRNMVTDPHAQAAFRKFFHLLITHEKEKGALLFHCAMGKDRTGFASALILYALGCSKETVLKDYLLTNASVEDRIDQIKEGLKQKGASEETAAVVYNLMLVKQSYIESAFEEIYKIYGSIDAYLKQVIGLGEQELGILSSLYLD